MSTYDPNYVAKKSHFLVGQKAIIFNVNQEILILKRSDKTKNSGLWSLPGGGLERGEDPNESIIREIVEETGLSVKDLEPFHSFTYNKDDKDSVLIIGYKCKTELESIELNWEHTEFKWVNPEEARHMNLTEHARKIIENSIH